MLAPLETELLAALQAAVKRIEIANAEGQPILSAWLPDARAAIAKAEAIMGRGNNAGAWARFLPDGWEIRPRAEILEADGSIPEWAKWQWYVLDGRTDIRGEGDTVRAAMTDAGIKFEDAPASGEPGPGQPEGNSNSTQGDGQMQIAQTLSPRQIEEIVDRVVPLIAKPEDYEFFKGVLFCKLESCSSSAQAAAFMAKLLKTA